MAAHEVAITILRKKWTPQIVLALRPGRKRFSDLHRELPLISHKMLIQQLRALERDRLIVRQVIVAGSRQVSYELSDAGRSLLPIIDALEEWAHHHSGVTRRTK
jgi:DNA-binding HxlR family transcriptional regulator